MRIGIIGGAGYAGGELVRLLLNHSQAEIAFVSSESNAGNALTDVHSGLYGETDLRFTAGAPLSEADIIFICSGHGKSRSFIESHDIPDSLRIIDLSQDFRIAAGDNPFVYGLPELNRDRIASARLVANPGCFATCIQLALLPAAAARMLGGIVSVNAITGSTGAGQKPSPTTHYSWRESNMSVYKPFTHQHLPEIMQSLTQVQGPSDVEIDFIPYRGCFTRGIFATAVVRTQASEEAVTAAYKDFYRDEPFTHYVDRQTDLKQVVNTNKCLIHCEKHGDRLLITACIDNLLKGAAGQAVQNMNIMFGIDEHEGLRLKPSGM